VLSKLSPVDVARGRHALTTARERLELGIDLRGELGEQCELLAAARRAIRQRLGLDLLLERDDVLDHDGVQRSGVEEEHASLERAGLASPQAFASAEVYEERVRGRLLQCESQRRAPIVELTPDELDLRCGQAAGIHQLQHQRAQILVLDARRARFGERYEAALDLLRARERHQAVQLGPLRRYPLLVAKEAYARIERKVHDLAADELGQ